MKIDKRDFDDLRKAVVIGMCEAGVLRLRQIRAAIAADYRVKDKDKRYRWDLLWLSPAAQLAPVMNRIYQYADDTHVDTALRRIVPDGVWHEP